MGAVLGADGQCPFSHPLAHRTGLAELPHPARLCLAHEGHIRAVFKTQQPALPMQYCEGELVVAAPCHFVPSNEERALALANVVIDAAES